MKLISVAVLGSVGAVLAVAPAFGRTPAHPAASTYSHGGITFKYPSNWQRLPTSLANSLGDTLASSANGFGKLAAVAGVDSKTSKPIRVGIAVLAKLSFSKKAQRELRGNRNLFIRKFKKGVAGSAKRTLSQGHASFAGQNADEIQVIITSGGTAIHAQFFVAIEPNNKSVDLAIMEAEPSNAWGIYAPALARIASSSKFH